MKIEESGSASTSECGSGSISQRHGSAHPDPDPHQNVMDLQHWFCRGLSTVFVQLVILLWRSFIYEEISEWNINKSANRLAISAPKAD